MAMQNPLENTEEEENFDLIKRYWTDPESTAQTWVDNSDLLDRIDRVTNKLANCVNLAQSTLDECGVPCVKSSTITKSCSYQSDDIFTHLDRIDNTLLDCIKLYEDTLNAKEYDSADVKFNQDFDEFMSRLDHLPNNDRIEINPEFLDSVNNREFTDYVKSLDPPDEFDDLDDWTDDVDLFMQGLCNPHKIDELWLQAKAMEM